jgi:hypothetical protein
MEVSIKSLSQSQVDGLDKLSVHTQADCKREIMSDTKVLVLVVIKGVVITGGGGTGVKVAMVNSTGDSFVLHSDSNGDKIKMMVEVEAMMVVVVARSVALMVVIVA